MAHRWTAVLLILLSLSRAGASEEPSGSCRIVCDPSSDRLFDRSNGVVIPLSSSATGAPGPIGPPGKAGPPGPRGPSGLGSSSKGGVAFSAVLQESFSQNAVLKFKDVITNLGSAYDASSGTFTCKTAGVYYFSFYIVKTGQNLRVDMQLNEKTVMSAVAVDLLHTDTASNSVVLQLKTGDRVYLQLNNSDLGKRDSQSRLSSFSGYLLYEI